MANRHPTASRDTSLVRNIYSHGLYSHGQQVYHCFSAYKSGVYVKTSPTLAGAHAVAAIGWGHDSSDYWYAPSVNI